MTQTGTLKVSTAGDRGIQMTRMFDAPRELVYEAITTPELVKQWLLGPPGWMMVVCEMDVRVGGQYRYAWRHEEGREMGMGGVFTEVTPPERLVQTEKFDKAWYPGEAINVTVLDEVGERTRLTLTVEYESQEARDGVMRSGMESGVETSYDRLAELLKAQR
jgi:uncharacterized protein YndB with AHSA1/START domain